jgi:phytoene synthase
MGICAAGHVYAAIGAEVRRAGHDSVTRPARTSRVQKLGWLAVSAAQAGISLVRPASPRLHARPEPEVAFLVQAAARGRAGQPRSETLLGVLAQLEARDRGLV